MWGSIPSSRRSRRRRSLQNLRLTRSTVLRAFPKCNGTRFDAELRNPLAFGSEPVTRSSMLLVGTQPPAGSIVHARLITSLDSSLSTQGQTVDAVLSQPLFSPDHKLILPEGTRLTGAVVLAKKARLFHRSGQLRFNFQDVDLPADVAQLKFPEPEPDPASAPIES